MDIETREKLALSSRERARMADKGDLSYIKVEDRSISAKDVGRILDMYYYFNIMFIKGPRNDTGRPGSETFIHGQMEGISMVLSDLGYDEVVRAVRDKAIEDAIKERR